MSGLSPAPKAVLITGAGVRLGRAMAIDMAAAGYAVAVHYNSSADAANEVVAQITSTGGKAAAVRANLADEAGTQALIGKAVDAIGPLGMVVNNASVFEDDAMGDERTLWDLHFNVHLRAPSLLAAAFDAQLPADTSGLIVNIIDERVLALNPKFHSYTLSKSALWTATRTMAQALAPRIRVNAIGPGPTLPNSRQTQADFDAQVNSLPLKIAPELSDFAKTLLYFADTPSLTGQMIALDGGQHLAWQTPDQSVAE
ncbi:SDR family oxidoreductase [Pseudahrensia aquimaris]|uniref:SDR family oxidoreductase n=1 Tax=Pseudahrensia aquimaris TaxID=744461 RepID=A0ABW3FDZ0_9HYPH